MHDKDIDTGAEPPRRVYISGPITGKQDGNRALFSQAADWIRAQGDEPINPHELDHNHGGTWEEYMRVDLKALLDCQSVVMLPEFTQSRGAMVEHEVARNLRLDIRHYRAG